MLDAKRSYQVRSDQVGKRLDRVLRDLMPDISLGRLGKLVRKRRILINGARCRHQQRLQAGDEITFLEAPAEQHWTVQGRKRATSSKVFGVEELEFSILYEDQDLLAVSKPAGLLVHGSKKEPNASTLIDQAIAYVIQTEQSKSAGQDDTRSLSQFVRPDPIFQPSLAHRIDRHTSGVVLIAKTLACLQALNRMIKKRQLEKYYLGMVKGGLSGGVGEIRAAISRRDRAGKTTGRSRVDVGAQHKAAQPALTRYKTLASCGSYSLVEFELVTGRTHQIRAHLQHVGSSIIGDDEYGDRALNRHARQKFNLRRHFLHAYRIKLRHPIEEGQELDLVAPLSSDLEEALSLAGFQRQDLPESLLQEFEENITPKKAL